MQKLTPATLLQDSIAHYRKHFELLITPVLCTMLPALLLTEGLERYVFPMKTTALDTMLEGLTNQLLFIWPITFIAAEIQGVWSRIAAMESRFNPTTPWHAGATVLKFLPLLALTLFLRALFEGGLSLVMVIPGIIAMLSWILSEIVVVRENVHGIAALKRSYDLMKTRRLTYLFYCLILLSAVFMVRLVLLVLMPGSAQQMPAIAELLVSMASWFVQPLFSVGAVLLYEEATR